WAESHSRVASFENWPMILFAVSTVSYRRQRSARRLPQKRRLNRRTLLMRDQLVRAREKRHRAVVVVHDVNRGRRFVHGSRDWKTARSFLRDLDVAVIHVTGAAGVCIKRRDVGIPDVWDV